MTLIELMISMLILAIVCVSWLTIFQVQSANRESYRREAVERLAGLMDIVSREGNSAKTYKADTAWKFDWRQGMEKLLSTKEVVLFTNSTIGYRLRVKRLSDVVKLGWISGESINNSESPLEAGCLENGSSALVGELFERSGVLKDEDYADSQRCVDVSGVDLDRFWRVVVVLRLNDRMN